MGQDEEFNIVYMHELCNNKPNPFCFKPSILKPKHFIVIAPLRVNSTEKLQACSITLLTQRLLLGKSNCTTI